MEYQGRPYLVAIRHIRPHVQTFNVEQRNLKLSDQSEDELFVLMKMTESLPPQSKRMIGFILEYKVTGMVWRQTPSAEHFNEQMFEKAKITSRSLTKRELSGMVYGRSLKFLKPPKDTTGYYHHLDGRPARSTGSWNIGMILQSNPRRSPVNQKKIYAASTSTTMWPIKKKKPLTLGNEVQHPIEHLSRCQLLKVQIHR